MAHDCCPSTLFMSCSSWLQILFACLFCFFCPSSRLSVLIDDPERTARSDSSKMKAQSFQIYAYLLSWTFRFSSASPLLSHTVEELAPVYEDSALRRRQSGNGTFVVTGIQNAGVQPRLEIRELEQDADAWNLYLLGMRRFQATDQTDKFSYYRLCGTHCHNSLSYALLTDHLQASMECHTKPGIKSSLLEIPKPATAGTCLTSF